MGLPISILPTGVLKKFFNVAFLAVVFYKKQKVFQTHPGVVNHPKKAVKMLKSEWKKILSCFNKLICPIGQDLSYFPYKIKVY